MPLRPHTEAATSRRTRRSDRARAYWDALDAIATTAVESIAILERVVVTPSSARESASAVRDLRGRSYELSHDLLSRLHRAWLPPLDRGDLHAITVSLDQLVESVTDATACLADYGAESPSSAARELVAAVRRAVEAMASAVRELRGSRDPKRIGPLCAEVTRERDACRALAPAAVAKRARERPDPMDALKWDEIYRAIGSIAERAASVARAVEDVLVEQA